MKSVNHLLFAILGMSIICGCTKEVEPSYVGKYVDLGLSVKWAQVNLGATKREDFGDYFAWGETAPKEHYSEINYTWYDDELMLTKYCSEEVFGKVDGKLSLDPEDDAAIVRLGKGWRMPTTEECKELLDKCTWTWCSLGGVRGYKVTSNVPGYTDNYIFIPTGGTCVYDEPPVTNYQGAYWSSNLYYESSSARTFSFNNINYFATESWDYRWHGLNIRPVYDK